MYIQYYIVKFLLIEAHISKLLDRLALKLKLDVYKNPMDFTKNGEKKKKTKTCRINLLMGKNLDKKELPKKLNK